jgi:hypothetical protein
MSMWNICRSCSQGPSQSLAGNEQTTVRDGILCAVLASCQTMPGVESVVSEISSIADQCLTVYPALCVLSVVRTAVHLIHDKGMSGV